jgi:hypothetical protein
MEWSDASTESFIVQYLYGEYELHKRPPKLVG